MNVRKHLAGFAIFSIILGSAILINHFMNIPDASIPPVIRPEIAERVKERQPPVTYRVQQVSLDYNRGRSYTQLSLHRQLDQPVPEKVWVTTTFFSPDSTRAEAWSITTEISQPFATGNGESFVATENWDLPPLLDKPGAGYFARIYVSSESQGKFSQADYQSKRDVADAIPVVIHWPEEKSIATAGTDQKRAR